MTTATLEERDRQFEIWETEIRDKAPYASEGERVIVAGGKSGCILRYEVSHLPKGWVISFNFDFPGFSGGGVGVWTLYPSRQAAVDAMISHCLDRLDHEEKNGGGCMTRANRAAIPIMRQILQPADLFGFQEPNPPNREEWWDEMIAEQVGYLTLWQGFDLLDVIRATDCKPLSKSGSWFDIPLPPSWTKKGRYGGSGSVEDDEDEDQDDSEDVPESISH